MKHFLVFWHEDDHFGIYGVFDSIDAAIEAINKEPALTKVRLIHMAKIQEMEGTEVVDEIYIDELRDHIEIGMEDLAIAQEAGLEVV